MSTYGDIGFSGVLGGQGSRARQIARIGQEHGKFMESELLELCLDAMTSMGSSIANYREDLGDRVQRYLRVVEREDEAGYLEIEVRFTNNLNQAGADKRFRIHVRIEELET
jgi:hypothetical protein